MSKATDRAFQADFGIQHLKKIIKPGDTIWCVLRHRAASGMSRRISFFAIIDNEPQSLDFYIASALDMKAYKRGPGYDPQEGLIVRGCGMDVGAHVVGNLAYKLFNDERALRSRWM